MAPGKKPGDAGFTLVEMLVSLALMGLAAVMLLEGLQSAQRLWAGEASRTARGETIEAVQAGLRARLEHLRPVTHFDGSASFADVDGGDRELVFVAPPADAERPSAARRYRLALNDRGDLLLGSTDVGAEADPNGVPGGAYRDQVMLRDVQALSISYYGPGGGGGAPQWWSDWKHREAPPDLVKIKAELKAGDRRVWPELIVHPAATVDTLCSIDAASGLCRGRQ
ncbi:type II secretion system protein J [Phenylobacterium sp.]|uniref:PulJ/GspJ family protein n=1 Tax=Phenylobacterium sp. TaxID=1871053 RepID=UPI00121A7C42|nr:prepilin-type N-terminal cleavage/methylation domain-containing protein [Phenylobacterium sp.]THD60622.1 MAG: prepilin-type N-terminal cleavage/methylation domain-containing protein [Phenylobacterium sp.]